MRWQTWSIGIALATLGIAGCRTPCGPTTESVAQKLGEPLAVTANCREFTLPPGADFADGLTEDEAVAIALWNNAQFQELLTELGIARGDLIQAGLLPNPEFGMFFGVADKPFKYVFDFPIESLWLRPIRIRTARHEAERTSERLAQSGLDLIRDVRQAYAEVLLAQERVKVAEDSMKLRSKIAEFAEKRRKNGELSPQEEVTAKVDALRAVQDAARIGYEVPVAEERLRNLLGLGAYRPQLKLESTPQVPVVVDAVQRLEEEAIASRPDAKAASEAVAAAEERLRFARIGWVRVLGVGDATSGTNGHQFGPALRFTVPLFNRNQGGIARAEAERDRACRARMTIENQIRLDVRRAHLRLEQATTELAVLQTKVRPELEGAVERAQASYRHGDVTVFIVLESTRQLLDANLRAAELATELRRSRAELERSVGRRFMNPPTQTP